MLGVVSIAVVGSILVSLVLPRTYESRATLYVGQALNEPQLDYGGLLASQILAQTYARLATTRPVLQAVIAREELTLTPEELQEGVSAEIPLEGTLVTVVARSSDPATAAGIANAVAQQLLRRAPRPDPDVTAGHEERISQIDAAIARVEAEVAVLRDLEAPTITQRERRDILEERLVTFGQARAAMLEEVQAGSPNALTLVDPAVEAAVPVAPSRTLIVGGTAIVALALAVLLAYIIYARRPAPERPMGPRWTERNVAVEPSTWTRRTR
jgi:uncharacterized protein involved in exopolysaccharide biosynthesis